MLRPKVSPRSCISTLSCPKFALPKASRPSTFSGASDSPSSTLQTAPLCSPGLSTLGRSGHPTGTRPRGPILAGAPAPGTAGLQWRALAPGWQPSPRLSSVPPVLETVPAPIAPRNKALVGWKLLLHRPRVPSASPAPPGTHPAHTDTHVTSLPRQVPNNLAIIIMLLHLIT